MQIFNDLQNQVNLFQISAKKTSISPQRKAGLASTKSQMERANTDADLEIDSQQPYAPQNRSKEDYSSVMFKKLNNSSLSFRVDQSEEGETEGRRDGSHKVGH